MSDENGSKLKHLIAQDLFSPQLKQLFDPKTGKWQQTIREGQEAAQFEQETILPKEPIRNNNPSQLLIF